MKKNQTLKIVIVLFLAMVLLVGGAITTLLILFPQQKIIALIVPHIEKALARQVSVDKAGLTLYPSLGVSISGLRVSNTVREGFSGEPFVSIGRFTANISVASLFKGNPEITSIIIDRPQIRIEIDTSGAFNFDDLALLEKKTTAASTAPASPPALPVPLTLKKFAIANGSIVFDDKKSGNQIIVESVNENLAVSIGRELKDLTTTGSLVLAQVSVKTRDLKKPLSNVRISLSHDITANLADGTVGINEVRLSLQKVYLSLKGTVKNAFSPAPKLDLAITSDPISLGDLLKEIPVELAPMLAKLTATGTMEIGLSVNGALEKGKPLPLKGTFGIKNGMVKTADLPQTVSDFNTAISFTDNSLSITTMKCLFGTSPIEIKGTVDNFKKPFIDIEARADINLGEVKEVATLPQDATIAGRLKLDVLAKGEADPNDPTRLDCKGLLDMQNVVVLWNPLMKPATLNGTLTLTSKAVGENIKVTVGSSSLNMTANLTNYLPLIFPDSTKRHPRPLVEFTLSSPMINVDEAVRPPPAAKTPEVAEATANTPLLTPLPGIDMKGTVTTRTFIYQGFTMSDMTAKVNVVNDVADIAFSTGFAGGTIGNAVHADLKNINNIIFSNNLTVRNVEVNDLMQRFGDYVKPVTPLNREIRQINKSLFGRINLTSSLQGNGGTADAITKSITGTIGANMSNGKIVNTPAQKAVQSSFVQFLKFDKLGNFDVINFRNLTASIRLANGNAIIEDLRIPSDAGDWLIKGNVGFDALMNMAVSTKLTKDISARLLAVEGTAKSVAKGAADKLLQGTRYAGATALLDNMNLVPRDNDGRVTLKFGLGGPMAGPKVTALAFGEGTTGSSQQQQATPQQSVKQQVQQAVTEKKQEIIQKVEDTKAEAQQRLEQEKQKAQEELRKREESARQEAKKKLGGFLKR